MAAFEDTPRQDGQKSELGRKKWYGDGVSRGKWAIFPWQNTLFTLFSSMLGLIYSEIQQDGSGLRWIKIFLEWVVIILIMPFLAVRVAKPKGKWSSNSKIKYGIWKENWPRYKRIKLSFASNPAGEIQKWGGRTRNSMSWIGEQKS
jgi:hypothetical protein